MATGDKKFQPTVSVPAANALGDGNDDISSSAVVITKNVVSLPASGSLIAHTFPENIAWAEVEIQAAGGSRASRTVTSGHASMMVQAAGGGAYIKMLLSRAECRAGNPWQALVGTSSINQPTGGLSRFTAAGGENIQCNGGNRGWDSSRPAYPDKSFLFGAYGGAVTSTDIGTTIYSVGGGYGGSTYVEAAGEIKKQGEGGLSGMTGHHYRPYADIFSEVAGTGDSLGGTHPANGYGMGAHGAVGWATSISGAAGGEGRIIIHEYLYTTIAALDFGT